MVHKGLECPICGSTVSSVTDTRPVPSKGCIRRRRECSEGHRYTTHEILVGSRKGPNSVSGALGMRTENMRDTLDARIDELMKVG